MLVKSGRLILEGRGRGSRYRVPRPVSLVPETAQLALGGTTAEVHLEVGIPVSPEGEPIKRAVRAPIQDRRPVGYDRTFLDRYRANETFYLSSEVRRRLRELGTCVDEVQPAGTYARKIHHRLLIDLSWNSSRLEGNTYSLLETERLLEHGDADDGKSARETQMILNHKATIDLLVEQAEYVGFDRHTVLSLHALLADNLLDPRACGRLRSIPVTIGGTPYHPLEIPQLIDECFRKILEMATAIEDPFEQAFFAMVQLPYLHPFEDVNKRVSRLAANLPLIRDNLCPLSFIDVPERDYVGGILGVYELNRTELLCDVFCWAVRTVLRPLLRGPPVSRRARSVPAEVSPTRRRMRRGDRHEDDGQEVHHGLASPARFGDASVSRQSTLGRRRRNGGHEPARGQHRTLPSLAAGIRGMEGVLVLDSSVQPNRHSNGAPCCRRRVTPGRLYDGM